MMHFKPNKALGILLLSVIYMTLIACDTQTSNKASSAFPNEPVQISAEIQSIYQRTCKNCHTVAATQAPLTGDKNRWEDILEKGMDKTLENAMMGYKGMPAAGQCYECSPEQMESLILYMSHPKI